MKDLYRLGTTAGHFTLCPRRVGVAEVEQCFEVQRPQKKSVLKLRAVLNLCESFFPYGSFRNFPPSFVLIFASAHSVSSRNGDRLKREEFFRDSHGVRRRSALSIVRESATTIRGYQGRCRNTVRRKYAFLMYQRFAALARSVPNRKLGISFVARTVLAFDVCRIT